MHKTLRLGQQGLYGGFQRWLDRGFTVTAKADSPQAPETLRVPEEPSTAGHLTALCPGRRDRSPAGTFPSSGQVGLWG